MSGLQNFSDGSQSPGTSQRNASFSTSTEPVKRKNSSPLANSIVPIFVDDDISDLAQFPLLPPQPLRKSISVDSFAHYNNEYWPNRAQSVSRPESSRHTAASATNIRLDKQRLASGRLRGESLSSGSTRILDADGDRYDPLSAAATERYRRALLKTHDPARLPIRGGDLPLPSRTLSSSTTASTSSTLPTPAHMSRNPSLGQASDIPGSSGGRSRSGSLGYNPSLLKKIMINTQVPPSIPRNQDIFLLVLGTRDCGKSTLIRRGLSGANLGETSVICENPRYICRLAYVGLDNIDSQGSYSHVLQVIEGDISTDTTSLPPWPSELPPIDGVILCYDSSSYESFRPIKGLLKGYREMGLPVVVLHCKVDLTKEDGSGVNPQEALAEVKKYDTGLIQVSSVDPSLKYKMGKSIDYVLKAIVRQRGSNPVEDNRNPASPTILNKISPSSPLIPQVPTSVKVLDNPALKVSQLSDSLLLESAASTNQVGADRLVSEPSDSGAEIPLVPEERALLPDSRTLSNGDGPEVPSTQTDDVSDGDESHTEEELGEGQKDPGPLPTTNGVIPKGVRHGQWTHLNKLLDRLLFIAISEEDSSFIVNFLLTYRRFATPRNVLLAMQKRIRQLDDPSGDPMFACFAQMRVCHLLETWIREYPNDFAVKGTVGALSALLTKSIMSKTHLLHYGSELLPFLEQLPSLEEEDSAWALKTDIVDTDSENYYGSDDDETVEPEDTIVNDAASIRALSSSSKGTVPSRDRKSSLPLTKTLFSASPNEPTPKQLLKDLVKLANEVLTHDSDDIANEITRHGAELFLKIKPRDWVHFTFVSPTRKKGKADPIGEYNSMANYLADWVSCLILCHDQPRQRARQVEKFVEIALRIRHLNNYSGLRAFVAGINLAADDVTLEAFKMKSPEAAKNLMSWDVLLKQLRSHRAYRLALRNSKGGCIPALEVHMQDLIKANEGNPNQREDDPTLIHWGKYNMIGRFIGTVVQCQSQCRSSPIYKWTERLDIAELLRKRTLMPPRMQEARLNIPDHSDNNPSSSSSHRDTRGLRKLIFW